MSRSGRERLREVFLLLALVATLVSRAPGQAGDAPKLDLRATIEKVKSGDFDGRQVRRLARARVVEAMPALEEQFSLKTDVLLKTELAFALVQLGDKDDRYWDFLVKQAEPALDSQVPDPYKYDKNGTRTGHSPTLREWARVRGVDMNIASEDVAVKFPNSLLMLAMSKDQRAIPVLRRGLWSSNSLVMMAAARGLAQLQDADSVPLIISAVLRSQKAQAGGIAEWLVFFEDPSAQRAVDHYLTAERARYLRFSRDEGKKPFDLGQELSGPSDSASGEASADSSSLRQ